MNKDLFCSMQRKLIPSQQAVDQLKERLVQSAPAGRQPTPGSMGAGCLRRFIDRRVSHLSRTLPHTSSCVGWWSGRIWHL